MSWKTTINILKKTVKNMRIWLQKTPDIMPEEWTTKWLQIELPYSDIFCINDQTSLEKSIKDIYEENYIYCNQQQDEDYNDTPINILVCILFTKRYKVDLVIYTEVCEGTLYVII